MGPGLRGDDEEEEAEPRLLCSRKQKRAGLTARPPERSVPGNGRDQAMSKRSAFITLVQAATKSFTNFSRASSWA